MRSGATLDALNFALAGAREGFGPFIAVYLQAQSFDPAMTGVIMALAGVGGLAMTTPIGHLIDRSHRKRELLVLAVVVIAIGSIVIVSTRDIRLIGAAQLAIGVGDTALAPLLAAITLGMVGLQAFAVRLSRNEAFNHAGNATRSAIAAGVGYLFGLEYVAVTIVATAVATSIIAAKLDADAIDHVAARSGECDDQSTWQALMGMPGLLLLAAVVLVFQAASSSMLPFLAQARTLAGDDPSLTTGAMCVISRIVMVPAALMAPWIAARRGYSGVMTIALAMVAARGFLAYFSNSWALVVPVEILEGLANGMACVAIPALNAEVMAGTGRANAGLGAVLTAFGAGATISPLIGGFVAQKMGFAGSFVAFAGVALFGLVMWLVGRAMVGRHAGLERIIEPATDVPPPPNPQIAAE